MVFSQPLVLKAVWACVTGPGPRLPLTDGRLLLGRARIVLVSASPVLCTCAGTQWELRKCKCPLDFKVSRGSPSQACGPLSCLAGREPSGGPYTPLLGIGSPSWCLTAFPLAAALIYSRLLSPSIEGPPLAWGRGWGGVACTDNIVLPVKGEETKAQGGQGREPPPSGRRSQDLHQALGM